MMSSIAPAPTDSVNDLIGRSGSWPYWMRRSHGEMQYWGRHGCQEERI